MPVTCKVTDPGSLNHPVPASAPSALLRQAAAQESALALRQFWAPDGAARGNGWIGCGCASVMGLAHRADIKRG